jgi:hypothetical protein
LADRAVRRGGRPSTDDEDATMSTTTIKPDIEGLRLVAEAVRSAPDHSFRMSRWGREDECGFAGCAVGWFCHANPADRMQLVDGGLLLDGMRSSGWAIVCERFLLSDYEATQLFDGSEYAFPVTRAAVVARLEQFIADHESK